MNLMLKNDARAPPSGQLSTEVITAEDNYFQDPAEGG